MPRIAGQDAREDVTNSSLCGALADNPLTPPLPFTTVTDAAV